MAIAIQTISLLIGLMSVIETLVLFVCARLARRYPSIGWWVLGRALNAVGALLLSAGELLPAPVTIIGANGCLVLALLPTLYGINRFAGRPRPRQELFATAIATVFVLALFPLTLLNPNAAARTFLAMASGAALNLLCAWSLTRPAPPARRRSFRAAALIAGGYSVWLTIRALLTLLDTTMRPALDLTPVHTATLIGMVGAVGLWTIAMIAMVVERLLYDLHAAQESERATLRQANAQIGQAYEAVHEREQLFRLTFDQSPLGAAILDHDGRFVRVNAALCQIMGRGEHELIGAALAGLIERDDMPALSERLAALAGGRSESLSAEVRASRGDDAIWVRISARLVLGAESEPHRVLLLADDITERKAAEQRLQMIERQQQLMLRTIPVQFWFKDLEGRYILASDVLCAFHGYPPGALVGQTPEELYSPELAAYIRAGDREVLAQGIRTYPERQLPDSSGRLRWIDATRAPVYDERGALIGITGVSSDVTDRREGEEALRRSREQLELALWGAELGLWDWHLPSQQMEANQQHTLMLGYAPEELAPLTERWIEHIHPADLDRVKVAFGSAFDGRSPGVDLEYRIRHADGSWRQLLARGRTVAYDAQGRAERLVGITQDITARQHAEEQLRQRIDELLALNQIVQALTSWAGLDRALETVGRMLHGLFRASTIAVWACEEPPTIRRLICVAAEASVRSGPARPLRASALVQHVMRHDAAVITTRDDDLITCDEQPAAIEDRATLLAPMRLRGEPVGLLVVRAASATQTYAAADLALAQTVAGALATALENARLFEQAQQMAVDRERRRIAQDLHDSVNQALLAAVRTAELVPQIWELDPEEGREAMLDLRRLTRGALEEMRALMVELYPRTLTNMPLHQSLRNLAPVASKTSAVLDARLSPTPLLPPDVQVAMYRIAQEALNNACRHADAAHVALSLHVSPPPNGAAWDGEVTICVADDGHGFDLTSDAPGRIGLISMRERAADIGAALAIHSYPGGGTTVIATWRGNAAPQKELHQP